MATQLGMDEDIFARPPRALARQQAKTARITCRVCDMSDLVPLDHVAGPFCRVCASDFPAARAKAKAWLNGVLAQMDTVLENFEIAKASHLVFWAKIEEARIQGRPDSDARARAAHPAYARLLNAEATMLHAFEPLGIERARLECALELLDEVQAPPALRQNEYAIPADATPIPCRSCGAGMVFVKTPAGKALPLSVATIVERDGVRWALPHFADCPNSREWSKK